MAMTLSLLIVNLMILFLTDFATRRCFLIVVRVLFLSAFVCSLLMFMIFAMQECDSDGMKCVPGGAGIVACFNVVILLVLCVLILITPAPQNPIFLAIWNDPGEKHHEEQPRSRSPSKRRVTRDDSSSRASSKRNLSPPSSPNRRVDRPISPGKSKTPLASPKQIHSPSDTPQNDSPKKSKSVPPASPKKDSTCPASPKKSKETSSSAKKAKSSPASPRKNSPKKSKTSSASPKKHKIKKTPDLGNPTENAPEEKVVEVEHIPCGRKITTTVTHPDGSKTVTYKIEDLDVESDDDTVER